jgi:CheY-like chemotaxis protein
MLAANDVPTTAATPTPYPVACARCRGAFDAAAAQWCSCLVTERTLVCPHCGSCFCTAGASYKSGFWAGAPRSLWDAKWRAHNGEAEEEGGRLPGGAFARPLVLVVDDEPSIRRVAVRYLRRLGYGVASATDGREGLARARSLLPDMVLTDALMPGLDGRDLALQLKGDGATARMPVVVMTALYTSMKYRLEGYKRYRVDDYLSKPVDPGALRAAVERHAGPPAARPPEPTLREEA